MLGFGYLGLTATSQDTPMETSREEELVGNNPLKYKVKPSDKFPYMLSLRQQWPQGASFGCKTLCTGQDFPLDLFRR